MTEKVRLNNRQYVIKQGLIKHMRTSEGGGVLFLLKTKNGTYPVDFAKYDPGRAVCKLSEGLPVTVYGYLRYSSAHGSHKIEAVKVNTEPVDYCYMEAYVEDTETLSPGRTRYKVNHLSLDAVNGEVYNCRLDAELFGKVNNRLKDVVQTGQLYCFTGRLEEEGRRVFFAVEHAKKYISIER